jgi:hypothetical protein
MCFGRGAGEEAMKVFVLQHVHAVTHGEEDIKMIGIYSSRALAEQAMGRLRRQPGFCDAPAGFAIDTYTIDEDNWREGYVTVKHG